MVDKSVLVVMRRNAKTRQWALANMNEELKKEFERIAEETQKQSHSNVMFYHRLGQKAQQIHDDEQKYGEGAIEKLAIALDIDRGLIYKAMTFAGQFSRDEVKALTDRRTSGGSYITWSHFSQLVVLEDKGVRDQLVEVIFEKDLSVRDLQEELKKRIYSGVVGQRQALPRTIMGGLSQLLTMGSRLVSKFTNEFEEYVFDPLENLEADKITDEIINRVAMSEETLKVLAKQSAEKAKEMEKLRTRLLQQIASRSKDLVEKHDSQAKVKDGSTDAPSKNSDRLASKNSDRLASKRSRRPIEA